jgi:cupin fold WbuC family metalloprotein
MIVTKVFNEEVLYAEEDTVKVDSDDIVRLVESSKKNQRRRIRLCTHQDVDNPLHEMIIIHERDTYVRPHRHPGKSESFHVIEGLVDIVLFADDGTVDEVIPMGDYQSGLKFYYRLRQPLYHTLVIHSEILVFHETTNGPFRKENTIFASWSPEEGDQDGAESFLAELRARGDASSRIDYSRTNKSD